MPFYPLLKRLVLPSRRNHVIDRLLALKIQLHDTVPDKDLERNLLLATWNIRDFGKKGGFGYGERLPESLFYIAEILSCFDLIAVQEVNELGPLEIVMDILGNSYSYIATDVADKAAGGNGERMTFIYDKRKVWFKNIAGEIVLPPKLLISKAELATKNGVLVSGNQFKRTPYVAAFQCGWFKFDLCTVHLYYGANSGPNLEQRIEEIRSISRYLSKRADESFLKEKSLILLGDFNIVHPEHKTMKALTDEGFIVPKNLQRPANMDLTKYYDQIAFKTEKGQIEYIDKVSEDPKKNNAGVFEIFNCCYREEDMDFYRDIISEIPNGKKAMDKGGTAAVNYYKKWKTWQMSDHHLLWTRLDINNSVKYLESCRVKGQ